MKYTPGPWQAVPSRSYEWAIDAPGGDPDTLSASWEELATVYGPEDDGRMGYLKGQANARLIAAAPEMYEALVKIANAMRGENDPLWDQARAAIAKAEGNGSA